MIIEHKTMWHHDRNADGTAREQHCCGCWHFIIDSDTSEKPYARCNECGDIRVAAFPGIATS